MKIEDIPWRGYRVRGDNDPTINGHGLGTDVYVSLRRLLGIWAHEPDRLAVAVFAYCWLGYNPVGDEIASSHREINYGLASGRMSDDEGWRLANESLHRKKYDDLRNRARGLLYALEAMAISFEFARIHAIQVDSAVIECRRLPMDERIAQLRAREERHEQDTPAPAA